MVLLSVHQEELNSSNVRRERSDRLVTGRTSIDSRDVENHHMNLLQLELLLEGFKIIAWHSCQIKGLCVSGSHDI